VFCDLSKAFDTLDHTILLKKMKSFGFSDKTIDWFKNYLSNRKQYVVLDNTSSSFMSIKTGVPQGSILGPLLFLLYVNDLSSSTQAKIISYADDTCLLTPISLNNSNLSIETQTNSVNKKLDNLYNWLSVNKLSLNIKKTKFMLFHFYQRELKEFQIPKLKINNNVIEKVDTFKFLGIHIDSTLSWHKHINETSNKISKTNGILSYLSRFIPSKILLIIYNSLVLSHLNYGITLWGFGNYERLQTIQKKALRNVNKSPFNSHCSPICKTFKTLLLDDLFKLACIKFYYKYQNKQLPLYFHNHQFINMESLLGNSSRKINFPKKFSMFFTTSVVIQPQIQIPISNKKSSQKCLRFYLPYLINIKYLPDCAITKIKTHSFQGFVNYCKNIIINNYNTICQVRNCFVCSCV